jgi:hypothetical protein
MMPAPGPLPQHDPSNFEPAVPSPRSKRFTGAFASREDAEAEVLHRVRDGALPAFGLREGQGQRETIPTVQLLDAKPDVDENRLVTKVGIWWGDLLFKRADVLRLWPPKPTGEIGPAPATSLESTASVSQSLPAVVVRSSGLIQMLKIRHERFGDDADPGLPLLVEQYAQLLAEGNVNPRQSGCSEARFVMAVTRDWLIGKHRILELDPKKQQHEAVLLQLKLKSKGRLPLGYHYESFRRTVDQMRDKRSWIPRKTLRRAKRYRRRGN